MATANKQRRCFFIGRNHNGVYGIGNVLPEIELIKCDLPITKVYPSGKFTFYTDDNHENIWFAGDNEYNQSGITNCNRLKFITTFEKLSYFKDNNIEICNICVSTSSSNSTFFLTKNKELYGCGSNIVLVKTYFLHY